MKHPTMVKTPLTLAQNLSPPSPPTSSSTVTKKSINSSRQNNTREQVIEVNFRYTTLIAMCLGFLFIWSTVVSAMFMKKSFENRYLLQKPMMIFEDQERLGRLMFSIGQEMLFTVDAVVSVQLMPISAEQMEKPLNFTWTLTDNDIEEVKLEVLLMDNFPDEMIALLTSIQSKLSHLRGNLSLKAEHPLNIINSYKLIFDLVETSSMTGVLYDRTLSQGPVHGSTASLLYAFTEVQNAPYSLFIKGMNRRFIELSYGTIYHLGKHLLNSTDGEFEREVSNYFYYFYTSHELVEHAFNWDRRIHHRYVELLREQHSEIFQSNFGFYRSNAAGAGRKYTKFVTEVVAFLLHSKDVLNTSFREMLQFTSRNDDYFHSIIALIYLTVLSTCTVLFVGFIRHANVKVEPQQVSLTAPNRNGLYHYIQRYNQQPLYQTKAQTLPNNTESSPISIISGSRPKAQHQTLVC